MSRTPRRPRLLVAAVSVVLLGVLFATDAGRDENLIKHDGRGYNNPHAGFVAPPRGTGPLAPATGSLIGTHSNDKHTGDLTEEDQQPDDF